MTEGSNWFDRKKSPWGDIFNICHSLLEFQPLSNQSLGDNMKKIYVIGVHYDCQYRIHYLNERISFKL